MGVALCQFVLICGRGREEGGGKGNGRDKGTHLTEDDIRLLADGGSISFNAYTRSVSDSCGGRPGEGGADDISESVHCEMLALPRYGMRSKE